jgi:Cu-Zn family superoxide dismutase
LQRHVGDLGNVHADDSGKATLKMVDSQVTIFGPHSVVGRACVLHRNEDDLGTADNEESKKTGNAGPRIACGVIGLAQE